MVKPNKEVFEAFILKLNESNTLIIVEGFKDKRALQEIGIANHIIVLSRKPLYSIIEDIAKISNEAIILTDFDKKGRELYGKLNRDLQKFGVKIDHVFREWLRKNTKLSHIEGIATYLKNIT